MKDEIRAFIIKAFLYGKGTVGDSEQLFDSGIVDSLGLIKLLAFIDRTYGVSLDMREISIANFDTIAKIADIIEAKKSGHKVQGG